jgi:hypothetical protein
MYIYIYMCVCKNVFMYIYTCIHACICTNIYIKRDINEYLYTYAFMYSIIYKDLIL